MPSRPFGHHDSDEQLFRSHAWYSLTMLAALELPDVPFHVFLNTRTTTTTALQDAISRGYARFFQAASEQPPSIPTVSDVCEVLQLFYDDSYAQHLKQDWLVKALNIPEASRFDMEHIAEMFNTATEDVFLYSQQQGITGMFLSKYTFATCTLFRLLLMSQKPTVRIGVCG